QEVAELRAGCDVRREVARVDVGDARDERGAEEREDAEARAVESLVDGPEALGELLLDPRGDHPVILAGPKNLGRGAGPAGSGSALPARSRSRRRTRPGS